MSRGAGVTAIAPGGYNRATMTDAALVRAVLEGNTTAFTTLVDRHARICIRFAARMLANVEAAEAITQAPFLRAYGALGRYDERLGFQTWLMSILINRCRTALGTRRRRDARIVVDEGAVAVAAVQPEAEEAA